MQYCINYQGFILIIWLYICVFFILGINADLYTLADDAYGYQNGNNSCFEDQDYKHNYVGLQNISPCQYGAPVYVSNPHFYQADPNLLEACEGLNPDVDIHGTYFKIQPVIKINFKCFSDILITCL